MAKGIMLSDCNSAPESRWRSHLGVLVLIATAVFLGHYLRLLSFGLYEDDYWAIVPNFTRPLGELPAVFRQCFTQWPTGRPLNHFLPVALSTFGYHLGGLPGIYALACVWLTLNAVLVFAVVRQLLSGPSALLASFAYILFPADTTKILLLHAAHVQGSMTFLLLGLLLWLRGGAWRWISYPMAALSLLSYESAFLPFLAVPLFWAGGRKATWRIWLAHLAACAVLIATIAEIRLSTGDTRAGAVVSDPAENARMLLTSLYLGPLTSLKMLGKGAWIGIQRAGPAGLASVVFLAGAVFACQPFARSTCKQVARPDSPIWPGWLDRKRTPDGRLPWWWVLVAASLMLSGSYALTLTNYPPTQEFGRITSTHVAAGWGMALVVAALFEGARFHLGKHAVWLTVAVGAWVGALLLYHDFNQREYVRAWNIEQSFWRQVVALAPDADAGWTIIVTGAPAEQSRMIASNSWADFHVGRLLLNPDPFANTPAFAHLGVIGHIIRFRLEDSRWEWKPRFWGGPREKIDLQRLVLLHSDRGVLRRIPAIDTAAGRLVSEAPPPAQARTVWPTTPLARIFFPETNTDP